MNAIIPLFDGRGTVTRLYSRPGHHAALLSFIFWELSSMEFSFDAGVFVERGPVRSRRQTIFAPVMCRLIIFLISMIFVCRTRPEFTTSVGYFDDIGVPDRQDPDIPLLLSDPRCWWHDMPLGDRLCCCGFRLLALGPHSTEMTEHDNLLINASRTTEYLSIHFRWARSSIVIGKRRDRV